MKRETGFYWVKIKKEYSPKNNDWQIAEWKDGLYFITGFELYYNDSDFEEIDERKIIRGEFYPVPTNEHTSEYLDRESLIEIVDACFHYYDSHNRDNASKLAGEMFDNRMKLLIEQNNTFATGGFIEGKTVVEHQRGGKGKPLYPHAWKITDK
jgi:hypothetical protein